MKHHTSVKDSLLLKLYRLFKHHLRGFDCFIRALSGHVNTYSIIQSTVREGQQRFFRYTTEHSIHAHTVSLFLVHGGSVTPSPHASQ